MRQHRDSDSDRVQLTSYIMDMLDDWGVGNTAKLNLLALSDCPKRVVRRYYLGEPLPDKVEVNERIGHLQGIADALYTSYPLNAQMAAFWLNQKNHRFSDQTPMNFMLEGGLKNMVLVRVHLDCAWDWHQSGSTL